MSEGKEKVCSAAPTLIFACSGAADVGALADQAARKLTRDGVGKMYCLAGVGGRVPGIMSTTAGASKILALDGCSLNCVKNLLEKADFNKFEHIGLVDLGFQKGASPVTPENVEKVVQAATARLAG